MHVVCFHGWFTVRDNGLFAHEGVRPPRGTYSAETVHDTVFRLMAAGGLNGDTEYLREALDALRKTRVTVEEVRHAVCSPQVGPLIVAELH